MMKHVRLASIVAIGLLHSVMLLGAPQISVTATITPRATYFVSDFYNKFQSQQPFGDLAQIRLENTTAQEKRVIIRFQAYTNLLGSADDPLIDAYTDPIKRTIIVPALGTTLFNPSQENSSIVKLHVVTESEIKDQISSQYGANILTQYAGMAPEGTYSYIVTVYDESDTSLTSPIGGPVTESITLPLEYGNINLMSPANQAVLTGYPINFLWQALNVRQGVDLHYILRVWDQNPRVSGVSPRVVIGANSDLQVDDTLKNRTTFSYHSISYMPLESGVTYYWQVIAKDGLGFPIGLGEGSPIRSFQMSSSSAQSESNTTSIMSTGRSVSNPSASAISLTQQYRALFESNSLDFSQWEIQSITTSKGVPLSQSQYGAYVSEILNPNGKYYMNPAFQDVKVEDVK